MFQPFAAQAPQEDCAAAPTPALAAECWDRQAPGAIPGAGDAAAVVLVCQGQL